MSNCLFCKIAVGEIPAHKIYETDSVLAFLDIGPVSKGHTLVIPKAHADNLSAGSQGDALELMKAIYLIAPKIITALGAAGYNLGMNHGAIAGQEVMHTHLHIMPRYEGEPRSFVKTHPEAGELSELAGRLKEALK